MIVGPPNAGPIAGPHPPGPPLPLEAWDDAPDPQELSELENFVSRLIRLQNRTPTQSRYQRIERLARCVQKNNNKKYFNLFLSLNNKSNLYFLNPFLLS